MKDKTIAFIVCYIVGIIICLCAGTVNSSDFFLTIVIAAGIGGIIYAIYNFIHNKIEKRKEIKK